MFFVKMQGAGNDFIILTADAVKQSRRTPSHLAIRLCQPHYALGADGLMVVEPLAAPGHLRMEFYNADGSPGEMCGNGARCLIRYCLHENISAEDGQVYLHTPSGLIRGFRAEPAGGPWGNNVLPQSNVLYTVLMPEPALYQEHLILTVGEQSFDCTYMELGNPGLPHLILSRPALPQSELKELAAVLCHHPHLKNGANVNFCSVIRSDTILLTTYERGVEDFTKACGSGASCAASALQFQGILTPGLTTVQTAHDILYVSCSLHCALSADHSFPPIHDIRLTGPACWVAEGNVHKDVYL